MGLLASASLEWVVLGHLGLLWSLGGASESARLLVADTVLAGTVLPTVAII